MSDYRECPCHKHLSAPEVYSLTEFEAAQCDSLWMRWCLLHQAEILLDIYTWLKTNTKVFDAWHYRCPVGMPLHLRK